MTVPQNLKYTKTHEWVRPENDGTVTVGITDHAQGLLGDMVYIELPKLEEVKRNKEICVVESVKAAADVYSPLSGTILAINQKASDDPAIVNQDPYGEGWLFKITPNTPAELNELISAEDYQKQLADH